MPRVVMLLFLFCISCPLHAKDLFLIPAPEGSTPLFVEAFGTTQSVTASRIQVSTRFSVLVNLDGMSAEEWERAKAALIALHQLSGNDHPYPLIERTGGTLLSIPWENLDQLKVELITLSPAAVAESSPEWSPYSGIVDALPAPVDQWEALIVIDKTHVIGNKEVEEYVQSLISTGLRQKKYRLFSWNVAASADGSNLDAVWSAASAVTCGSDLTLLDSTALRFNRIQQSDCAEIAVETPEIPSGFIPYSASLSVAPGVSRFSLHSIALASGTKPAAITSYAHMLDTFSAAGTAYAADSFDTFRTALQETLAINPMYKPALLLGAAAYEKSHDWEISLRLLEPVLLTDPRNAVLERRLGDLSFELRLWEKSERFFRSSLLLDSSQPAVLVRLSLIREQLHDDDGALSFVGQAMKLQPDRLDLVLRCGTLLDRLHRPIEAADSFEAALKLGATDDTRIQLIEILQSNGNVTRIADLLRERAASVPDEVTLRMRYAGIAESADLKDIALTYYTLAVASDARHEPAHYGRSRLLFEAGNFKDAHAAVTTALAAAPASGRLHALNIDLFEKENRIFDARAAAAVAADAAPGDSEVMRREARINDVFGDRAGETFEKYAALLEPSAADPAPLRETLQRGVIVALRDGDTDSARRMAGKLLRLGDTSLAGIAVENRSAASPPAVTIPGGMKGFAQSIGLRPGLPAKRFLQEYVQAILQSSGSDKAQRDTFGKTAQLYLDTVRALKGMGQPGTNGVEIRIETQTPDGYDHAERVLELLGWKIHRSRGKIDLEVGSGEKNSIRQASASGLSINEAEMKTRIEAGSGFTFTIHDDQVPLIFDEKFWLSQALVRQSGQLRQPVQPGQLGHGVLEEFLENPQLAKLYGGLASMSSETQQAMVKNVDLQVLLKRATFLALYGAGILVRHGSIVLPGGEAASAGWEKLNGVSPRQLSQFLTSLLGRDDGKLLAYYYSLAVVPARNQEFFTKSSARLVAFYKAFPFRDAEMLDRGVFFRQDDYFAQMTRELPLNPDGSIRFPGGARVWMLARDPSDNTQDIEKLLTQLSRVSVIDSEDAILLHMLDHDYSFGFKKFNQIEIFLAAARIDHLRHEPMDQTMALTLSQGYAKYLGLYPYIAALPALTGKDLLSLFRAAERIESFGETLNTALGEFHGVMKLNAMLGQSGCLSDKQAVEVLTPLWQNITAIRDASEMPAIVFASLENMMATAGKAGAERADDFLARVLTGTRDDREFSIEGQTFQIDRPAIRLSRIQKVLKLQSIGSLQDLLDIYDGANSAAVNPSAGIGRMEAIIPKLQEPQVVDPAKVPKAVRVQLESERIAIVYKAAMELKKETAKSKSKRASKLSADLIQSLDAFLEPVLVGWIYAYYVSPGDLVPSSDPLLVRKHLFFSAAPKNLWPATHVMANAEFGAYVEGGLAQFEAAAGQIGVSRLDPSESADDGPGSALIGADISAIRGAPWQKMDDSLVHFIALNLRLGREFVIQAAFRPEVRDKLDEAATGLIGLRRRAELMDSLSDLDFGNAFALLSSSDLFFLAEAHRKTQGVRLPGNIGHEVEMESAVISEEQLQGFGGSYPSIYGSTQNRLLPLGPYEEYDKLVIAEPLSERLSHFLLDLAEAADRAGLPLDALSLVAEPAIRELSSRLHMSTKDDWMSAIEAMRGIDTKAFIPALRGIR